MSVYTKTGDKGETSLASGQRVPKTDVRIEAYGTVDELGACIGLLRNAVQNGSAQTVDQVGSQLEWFLHRLFNLGAALSDAPGEWITDADVRQVEHWIDAMQSLLPRQRGFILPYGSESVCRCHICRTVCRRAERRMVEAQAQSVYLRFINRLSDYLFVLSRFLAFADDGTETEWRKDFSVEKLTE